MSERQGVEIDYCPKCRGVWLDRGELDKIIEKAAGGASMPQAMPSHAPQQQAPQYQQQPHYDQKHHKPHKKENFLMDMFDF